jgi:hypothetical protein
MLVRVLVRMPLRERLLVRVVFALRLRFRVVHQGAQKARRRSARRPIRRVPMFNL